MSVLVELVREAEGLDFSALGSLEVSREVTIEGVEGLDFSSLDALDVKETLHVEVVKWGYIERLISMSDKTTSESDAVRDELVTLETEITEESFTRYWEIIKDLKQSAIDPIAYGRSYNQTAIRNHLKNLA